ncbi:MAG: di-heme-cytochrome C peroxidase [Pseudomonadota bacterium]
MRSRYHHLSQGSEIFPIRVLRAIEDPQTGKPFMENMARFGLLPDPNRDDGIAVGLTLIKNDFTAGIEMVGITCAACHVAEIRYEGKGVRVDGGPNMFDMQKLYADMFAAAKYTIDNRDARNRALERLFLQSYEEYGPLAPLLRPLDLLGKLVNVGVNWDKLQARKELADVILKAIQRRDETRDCSQPGVKCTSGYGRLDAFNGTRNFLLARLSEENLVELDAPVKFPPIWGFEDYEWVEWTQNTNSAMERNFTETLGAGATVELSPDAPNRFSSSVPARNMHELEQLAYYLTPPVWPEEVLGLIDDALAARGETIFNRNCAGCHSYGPENYTENGILKLRRFSVNVVGTDPTAALRVACPVPSVGDLDIPKRQYSSADSRILKDCKGVTEGEAFEGWAFAEVVNTAVGAVKDKAYADDNVSAAERAEFEDLDRRGKVEWRDTIIADGKPYAARPLYGIWAAAPYLHNGSVPTLADLLTPPDDRITRFPLGHRDYDPVRVGYRTDLPKDEWLFEVDTEKDDGARNIGHPFGTSLSDNDKEALIEYLKTL